MKQTSQPCGWPGWDSTDDWDADWGWKGNGSPGGSEVGSEQQLVTKRYVRK